MTAVPGRSAAGVLAACACACALFVVFSWHRSHLVPHGATFERAGWLLTGDEPGYLLLAQAIASGDGLDVRPVHERGAYRAYRQREIIGPDQWTWQSYRALGFAPLLDRSSSWGNRQILPRLPLYSALVAPLTTRTKELRWLVALLQGLLVAAAAGCCAVLCARGGGTPGLHVAAALLFTLGALPAAYYTTQMFPETLAGVLLLCAFALYAHDGPGAAAVGNLLLVLSLWTTPRVAAGVLAASLLLLARDWRSRRHAGVAVLVLGWAAFLLGNLWVWGDLLLPNPNPASRNSLAFLPTGTLRFFFGNDVGLFFLSPVAWLGLVAGAVNLRTLRKPVDTAWAALFVGVLLVVASFPDARAGTCPAGRYQVIPAYLLAFPLIRLLGSDVAVWRDRLTPALYLLGSAGLAVSVAAGARPGYWFRSYHPLFGYPLLQPLYPLLPPGRWPAQLWVSLLWLGGLCVLLFPPRWLTARTLRARSR